ncbi:MAG: hypothetical protein ACREKH_03045 [Candidatus Rokuibacteriota bacterium]
MDFSANTSLIDRAEAIGSVQAAARRLGCAVYLTGAFARDLWLQFGAGIDIGRRTEDVDLAVECADWETFRSGFTAVERSRGVGLDHGA